ncbi:hypothetical protein SAMN05518861_105178 [Mesorhizobium sp. YR577]|nr:hypothetical protein SAMN05518861_105178 [Mesorhizobium sp. YR577]
MHLGLPLISRVGDLQTRKYQARHPRVAARAKRRAKSPGIHAGTSMKPLRCRTAEAETSGNCGGKILTQFPLNPLFSFTPHIFSHPIYPPLSSLAHTRPRKSASNGIPGAHRVSGGSVGVRAGGAAVALLGDEPLSPGPWLRLATRMWRRLSGTRALAGRNGCATNLHLGRQGPCAPHSHPRRGSSLTMARCESRRGDDEVRQRILPP